MTMEKVDDWMKRITKAGVKDIITREMVTQNEEQQEYYDENLFLHVRKESTYISLFKRSQYAHVTTKLRPGPSSYLPGRHFLYLHITLSD